MAKVSQKIWLGIFTLLAISLGGIAFRPAKSIKKSAFLVREESAGYLVAWKEENLDFKIRRFSNLNEAVTFVTESLSLKERQVSPRSFLEFLSIQSRFGNFVLVWKEENVKFLYQMTFQSERDAEYFRNAFHRGAYTPSPFGHAVAFQTPIDSPTSLKILSTSFK